MGRSNYPRRGPRTSLVANMEIERAMRGERTPSFGIRRPLEQDCADQVVDALFGLQEREGIPDEPKGMVRDYPTITLLSRRVVGRQTMRGMVAGYNLGKTRAQLARDPDCRWRNAELTVDRGPVMVFRNRVVFAAIESSKLTEEIDSIHGALALAGLKGVPKKNKPHVPHLTLVDAGKGFEFSKPEQLEMVRQLEDRLPGTLQVDGWESYPFDIFDAQSPAVCAGGFEQSMAQWD